MNVTTCGTSHEGVVPTVSTTLTYDMSYEVNRVTCIRGDLCTQNCITLILTSQLNHLYIHDIYYSNQPLFKNYSTN